MTILCVLTLMAAAMPGWQAPLVPPQTTYHVDDAAVLRAVLEHTVLPEIRKHTSGRLQNPIALVWDRTVAVRGKDEPPDGRRLTTEGWSVRLAPNPAAHWPGMVEGVTVRRQLLESFELRNAVVHPVPPIEHPEVLLVPTHRAKEIHEKYQHRTLGSSSVTLPGYSTNGRGLVYVSYVCGSLCGYGWLFVLQKSRTGWRVESSTMLWIS